MDDQQQYRKGNKRPARVIKSITRARIAFSISLGGNSSCFARASNDAICNKKYSRLRHALLRKMREKKGEKNLRKPWKWETSAIDRYHVDGDRVRRKTIGEQISRWLAWFKSSLKFRRVVPRMLSTSNWRLTPGRRDGSSFRQIGAAMKHRISTTSVSTLLTSRMINSIFFVCISSRCSLVHLSIRQSENGVFNIYFLLSYSFVRDTLTFARIIVTLPIVGCKFLLDDFYFARKCSRQFVSLL